MQLFYSADFSETNCILDEVESRHCIKVLRYKEGKRIYITNGKGAIFEAEIITTHTKGVRAEIITRHKQTKPDYKIHIAIAPTKNSERFEWFLEKSTEIGVDAIIPLICHRSERAKLNMQRMEKILIAAIKQSNRAYLPSITNPVKFNNIFTPPIDPCEKFIAHYIPGNKNLKNVYSANKNALVLIGPEGDFTEEEIKMAKENNFISVNLSDARLRTETAGIVACTIINQANAK